LYVDAPSAAIAPVRRDSSALSIEAGRLGADVIDGSSAVQEPEL
jgi:hypothetical protein